jgi:hypothetical protein
VRGGLKTFLVMALVQFISYSNLVINTRAIAGGLIPAAMVTDAAASAISFFIIRKVAKEDGYAALVGMMLGGSLAAWFGIWLTGHW